VLGASDTRLIVRHVLPQVAPLLVATGVLMVAYAIFAETAIAFLGLGDPSKTSWGLLIENAFSRDAVSVGAWWAIVPPGIAVATVVVSLTMLGTAIEDALNPRLRVSHVSVRRFRLRPAPRMTTRERRRSVLECRVCMSGSSFPPDGSCMRFRARAHARAESAWGSWASRGAARRRSASR
jgi:peptide/nickel transport system permease protein